MNNLKFLLTETGASILIAQLSEGKEAFINTSIHRGGQRRDSLPNGFNRFQRKTVETVKATGASLFTPLKQGVNEMEMLIFFSS